MMVTYEQDERARHAVNFKAVLYTGLIVGGLFLLVPRGHPWASQSLPTHAMGRPLFGGDTAGVFMITGIVQMVLSLAYTFIVAAATFWMRTVPAIISGAIVGGLLYGINYVVFHFLVQNTPLATESTVVLTHVGFCMIAAGAYKGFSVPKPRRNDQPA